TRPHKPGGSCRVTPAARRFACRIPPRGSSPAPGAAVSRRHRLRCACKLSSRSSWNELSSRTFSLFFLVVLRQGYQPITHRGRRVVNAGDNGQKLVTRLG